MSDPTPTTPGTPTAALAPEEWAQVDAANHGDYNTAILAYGMANSPELYAGRRHALAALCLYEQPFGFTHSDVAILNLLADAHDVLALPGDHLIAAPPWWPEGVPATTAERAKALRSLTLRIAALLPEEPR